MTTEFANYFWDLDNEYIGYKLQDFAKIYGAKHTPSVLAVKNIPPYLGSRQRKRKGFDLVITNESKAQIHSKTAWSEGTISDVIKFLEWMGLVKTIRRGGGKNKMPTVRHMITTGPPIQFQSKQRGIIDVLNGKRTKHDGIKDDQDGELPDTPKELPREIAHDVYVHESFTSKNIQTSKEEEENRHKSTRSQLDACEDKIGYLEELNSLAGENSHFLSLLSDPNELALQDALIARLSEVACTPKIERNCTQPTSEEVLFENVIKAELKIIPTQVPINALKKKKQHYLPLVRDVLDQFPGTENNRDAVTYVLSKCFPNDRRFICTPSTYMELQKHQRPLLATINTDQRRAESIVISEEYSDDLGEYSLTPDDVKDLMARW